MIRLKSLFVLLLCTIPFLLTAQNKEVKKADNLYKLNKFAEAIPIYEAVLKEKESLSVQSKLAKCYFMLNNMDKAEQLYSSIVKNDKAKAIAYYNYAETLMSKSKYDKAKSWFQRYLKEKPNDFNAKTKLLACDMVQNIQPYFASVEITEYPFNSAFDDTAPVLHNNELIFASDRKSGVKLLKQKSGWTGRDFINIYSSAKGEGGNYNEPGSYSKFNSINKNTGSVSFSSDGKKAYFTRNGDVANKKKEYTMQLYQAESEDGVKWKNVKKLDICRVEYNYMHPSISPDGTKLFFVSDKPGGQGGTDIYYSERNGEKWGKPQNIGAILNTEGNEGFPFLSTDSKLYFSSKGHIGFGGFDIFYAEQKQSGLWKKPVNVGKPINSSVDDISIFLIDGENRGLFTSSRAGGDDDVFEFSFAGVNETNDEASAYDFDESDADHSIFDEDPIESVVIEEKQEPAVVEQKEVVEERPKTYSEILAMQNAGKTAPPREKKKEEIIVSNEKIQETIEEQTAVSAAPKETVDVETEDFQSVMDVEVEDQKIDIIEEPSATNASDVVIEKPVAQTPISETKEVAVEEMVKIGEPEIKEVEIMKEESINEVTDEIVQKEDEAIVPTIPENPPVIMEEEVVMEAPVTEEIEEMGSQFDDVIEEPKSSELMGQPEMIEIETAKGGVEVQEVEKEVVVEEQIIDAEPITFDTQNNELEAKVVAEEDLLVNEVIEPEPVLTMTKNKDVQEQLEEIQANPVSVPRSDIYVKDNALDALSNSLQSEELIVGSTYKIAGANYGFNKVEVPASLAGELDRLISIMNDNSNLSVELVGHTASFGQSEKNMQLSINRAKAAADYLTERGIARERISFNGHGETMLLNKCKDGILCSLEQHKENERLELVITQNQ